MLLRNIGAVLALLCCISDKDTAVSSASLRPRARAVVSVVYADKTDQVGGFCAGISSACPSRRQPGAHSSARLQELQTIFSFSPAFELLRTRYTINIHNVAWYGPRRDADARCELLLQRERSMIAGRPRIRLPRL